MISTLIISQQWDVNAAAVSWGLNKMGVKSIWVSSLVDQDLGAFSLKSTNNGEWVINGGIEK